MQLKVSWLCSFTTGLFVTWPVTSFNFYLSITKNSAYLTKTFLSRLWRFVINTLFLFTVFFASLGLTYLRLVPQGRALIGDRALIWERALKWDRALIWDRALVSFIKNNRIWLDQGGRKMDLWSLAPSWPERRPIGSKCGEEIVRVKELCIDMDKIVKKLRQRPLVLQFGITYASN